MPQKELSLDNLDELDFGILGVAFKKDLAHLVADCNDRPDGQKRSISLTFNIVPEVVSGKQVMTKVEGEIVTKLPSRRTQQYPMKLTEDGKLLFSVEAPENPDQTTVSDEVARKERERLRLANHG